MIKKGIIKAWDATNWQADIQIVGSMSVWLESVPVNRGIATGDMVVGRSVAVVFLDPSNPIEAVVVAVWA